MPLLRNAFLLNSDRLVPIRNAIGMRAQSNVSPTVFTEFNVCVHVTLDLTKKLKKTKIKKRLYLRSNPNDLLCKWCHAFVMYH